ncbi:MAG: hypothetical protein IJD68_02975 [Ruminococcus sp.]|nr:hypothetical protein [Ruminococcus sp.]
MLTSCQTQTKSFTVDLITTPLCTNGDTSTYPYTLVLDETEFFTPPQTLSPSLAKASIVLSSSAYKCDSVHKNLEALGFEHKAKFNYSDDYDENAVGIAIASRKIEDTTVVAVVFRGTFAKEWYSNFDIGKSVNVTKVHEGFSKANEFAHKKLDMYMANYAVDKDHCKFLITGHSRGAAVANLFAKDLIDTYSKENVYAYTFATPNTTTNETATSDKYSGIFNFVNPEDFIAYIPLESWGFTKYGTTITFFTAETDPLYEEKLQKVKQKYLEYRKRDFITYNGEEKKNEFLSSANELAPTIKDYYDTKYEIAGLKMSVYEYMTMFAHVLNEENIISNGLIFLGSDDTEFEVLKNYIMLGMDNPDASMSFDYSNSLISYSHPAETYLCFLEVYLEYL